MAIKEEETRTIVFNELKFGKQQKHLFVMFKHFTLMFTDEIIKVKKMSKKFFKF